MARKTKKPVLLLIFDGFGIAPPNRGNAVTLAKKPVFDHMLANYPTLTLQASGEAVGLSWGEMGNSEVCHLNIGAGNIIYQTMPKINKSIEDGTFMNNEAFIKAVDHAKKNNSRLHLMGLVSGGGVHSHINHLFALLDFCKVKKVKNVFIHAFLDGRDTSKDSAKDFISQLQKKIKETGIGVIASLSGRFYAMDRDNHWDREQKAFNVMTGKNADKNAANVMDAIETSYKNNVFDEEFDPVVIVKDGKPVGPIEDKDAVIFFNFRSDRARQITSAFTVPSFDKFERPEFGDLYFATMTEYAKDLPVEIAYPPISILNPLARIASEAGIKQVHAAETEKYAHVTFFFNGGKDDPFENEERILVPSPPVSSYDQKPEMSVNELTQKLLAKIDEGDNSLFIVNFANPDMVGHTGVVQATMDAITACDTALGRLYKQIMAMDGTIFLTADHGNCDEMINLQTGEVSKEHSTNPVPFIAINKKWEGQTIVQGIESAQGDLSILSPSGILADIAPTILKELEIDQPDDMTGSALI